MILGFKQNFPWGEPTNFREKILASVGRRDLGVTDPKGHTLSYVYKPSLHNVEKVKLFTPKIHTFREDKHDRWKAGMSIQMVYRGPKYSILDHFNKGIPELEKCKSIQKVKIRWSNPSKGNFIDDLAKIMGITTRYLSVFVDGKEMAEFKFSDSYCGSTDIKNIVSNDGFNNVFDFAKWFKDDWEGKIIHFTDFRY